MEATEKEFARQAWRSAQKKKAAKKFAGDKILPAEHEDSTNANRYTEESSSGPEPGQDEIQPRGADLAKLLEEAQSDRTAYFRSRPFLENEAGQGLPESALRDADKVMTIDFAALEDSISQLPIHEILGLDEQLFLSQAQAVSSQGTEVLQASNEGQLAPLSRVEASASQSGPSVAAISLERPGRAFGKGEMPEDNRIPKINHLPDPSVLQKTTLTKDAENASKERQPAPDLDLDVLLLSNSSKPEQTSPQGKPVQQTFDAKTTQKEPLKHGSKTTLVSKPKLHDLESWLDSL